MTTESQSEADACPECGEDFDSADALQDHFVDAHLVGKSADTHGGSGPSSTGSEEDDSAEPAIPDGGAAGRSFRVLDPEGTSTRPGRLADRLVGLLVLLVLGLVGAGVGLVYLPL